MEPGRDFRSIINSVPFTFLVGPNHTKLTVQSGLARHVSRPLDHLMNSGQTRESKHQIAVLEEEDVETFVAFCEYAYTGDYGVPPPGFREDGREQDSINNPFEGMFSGDAGVSSPVAGSVRKTVEVPDEAREKAIDEDGIRSADGGKDEGEAEEPGQESPREDQEAGYPSTTTEYPPQDLITTPRASDASPTPSAEVSSSRGRRRNRKKTDEQRLIQDPTSKLTPPRTPPGTTQVELAENAHSLDGEPTGIDQSAAELNVHLNPTQENPRQEDRSSRSRARPVIDTSFANQEYSPGREKGANLWDDFTAIEDTDFHPSLSYNYKARRPPNPVPGIQLPYLIFHAKLYVFATRYLIPDLANLCLRKLHRDLLNLGFPESDPENQYAEQFVLTTTKARMVVDLLSYTYTKTTRLEPITPSSATQLRDNELRRLVVHYAACKVRDLADYCPPTEPIVGSPFYPERPSARGFRALLDSLPELASDLIYRMI